MNVGRSNAFGKKNDPAAGSFDGDGKREVVTERVLPDLEHVHLLEEVAANGRAAAPAEVFRVTAKHGDHGSIPGGEKGVGESIVVGNEPAHGGGGADARVGERGDNVVEPSFARATIGIGEDKNLKVGRELFDANAKIVNFFTGACGLSSNDNMGLHAGGGSDAFDEAVSRIVFGSEDEKDLEILMLEFAEGNEITLEAGFHAAARAEDGGAGRIKSGVGAQTSAHVGKPLDTLPKQEESRRDLENRQKFEESFHAR